MLTLILQNPFRVLGVLANSSLRQQSRQRRQLLQHLSAGACVDSDDDSLMSLGTLQRGIQQIEEATSLLNLDADRLRAALFWFVNLYPTTDEAALSSLNNGAIEEAISIWREMVETGEVTPRNASAYHNLSTLMLALHSDVTDTGFVEAIRLRIALFDSPCARDFYQGMVDKTYLIDDGLLHRLFLDQLASKLADREGYYKQLRALDFEGKSAYFSHVFNKILTRTREAISKCSSMRHECALTVASDTRPLFTASLGHLSVVEGMYGRESAQYRAIASDLASSINLCVEQCFLALQSSDTPPSQQARDCIKLIDHSLELSPSHFGLTLKSSILLWMSEHPPCHEQLLIEAEYEELVRLFARYGSDGQTIANARYLALSAKEHLEMIKARLGAQSDLYLRLSQRLVRLSVTLCMEEFTLSRLTPHQHAAKLRQSTEQLRLDHARQVTHYRNVVGAAHELMNALQRFDMTEEFRISSFLPHASRVNEAYMHLPPPPSLRDTEQLAAPPTDKSKQGSCALIMTLASIGLLISLFTLLSFGAGQDYMRCILAHSLQFAPQLSQLTGELEISPQVKTSDRQQDKIEQFVQSRMQPMDDRILVQRSGEARALAACLTHHPWNSLVEYTDMASELMVDKTSAAQAGNSLLSVHNRTDHTRTLHYDGKLRGQCLVPSQQTRIIILPNGSYRLTLQAESSTTVAPPETARLEGGRYSITLTTKHYPQ